MDAQKSDYAAAADAESPQSTASRVKTKGGNAGVIDLYLDDQ